MTYSYRKPADYINNPVKPVDDELNEIIMCLRDDELGDAWADLSVESRATISPEAKARFASAGFKADE